MDRDPFGQERETSQYSVYGPKQTVLNYVRDAKKAVCKLEAAMQSQTEILNDVTRMAVYKELVDAFKQQLGNVKWEDGWARTTNTLLITELENKIKYLEKWGWAGKYTPEGEPKDPTLEDLIDRAYVNHGAKAVIKLMKGK